MHLSKRIVDVLRDAGLTARDLSAATLIHFSTIYNVMREGETYKFTPRTEDTLHKVLDDIDALRTDGKLPLPKPISAKKRSEQLLSLLATVRN